jgi:energy-coupling factor transporter ATP-binding protein EcfA2
MENFLTHIHINKIFHLQNIDIPIDEKEMKHLIITGKNGSGKTSVLNAMVEFLQNIKNDSHLNFLKSEEPLIQWENILYERKRSHANQNQIYEAEKNVAILRDQFDRILGKVFLSLEDINKIAIKAEKKEFLFAFYSANRKTDIAIPKNPEKPNLNTSTNIKEQKNKEFLKFLVDLKIQEALACNENLQEDAAKIKE